MTTESKKLTLGEINTRLGITMTGVAPSPEPQPVAVVGNDYTLLWAGGDAIVDIVKRHGLKIGSKLYAHPAGVPGHQQEQPQ